MLIGLSPGHSLCFQIVQIQFKILRNEIIIVEEKQVSFPKYKFEKETSDQSDLKIEPIIVKSNILKKWNDLTAWVED